MRNLSRRQSCAMAAMAHAGDQPGPVSGLPGDYLRAIAGLAAIPAGAHDAVAGALVSDITACHPGTGEDDTGFAPGALI